METCPRCGAARVPDLEWCGQCFARFDDRGAPPPARDAVVMVTRGADAVTSMPTWMRVAITLAALVGGGVLLVSSRPWWELGEATLLLGAIILVAYAAFASTLVARLWSPAARSRATEHLVVLDANTIQEVERRQASLVVRDDTDGKAGEPGTEP